MPASSFCVSLSSCRKDPDKATVAFVVASAALGSGKDTLVFLSADGVWAAVKSAAAEIDEGAPFKPLAELVGNYLAAGGKLLVCTPCCKKRGIEAADLFEGADFAGGAALVEWLSNGAASVSY
jgi:predicted peroxiredoxin